MIKKFASFLAVICLTVLTAVPGHAEEQYDQSQVIESPEIRIIINGKEGTYPAAPITVNNRTLLPLRAIFTNLGIPNDEQHIRWNDSEQSVTVINDKKSVYLKVNSNQATVDGNPVTLDVPAVIYNDRTYVPARFVSQSLSKKVAWDEETKSVIISGETDFNKIKSLLNKAAETTNAAIKFKNERQVSVTMQYNSVESVNKTNIVYQVDKKNSIALGNINTKAYLNNKERTSTQSQLWYENEEFYVKVGTDGKWIESISKDEVKEDLFNPFWLLEQSDNLYTGLQMSADSSTGDIILSGDIGLNSDYLNNFPSEYIKNFKISKISSKIVIDKNTNFIKQIECNYEGTVDIAGLNTIFKIESKGINSDINGSYVLERPKDFVMISDTAKSYYDTGIKLIEAGREKEAIDYFENAIKSDPRYIEAYKGKSAALYFLEEFVESNNVLDKAIAIDTTDSELLVLKARNLIALGEDEKGLELCNKAISINPKSDFAYYIKADALYGTGKFNEALEAVDKAIELAPFYEDAYISKLSLLHTMKNYEECISVGEKAGRLFPKNEDIPWYMADAYAELYKHEKAIEQYEEVMAINPKNDTVMSYMGLQYYYLQNYDKAIECADKALAINSYNNYAQQLKKAAEAEKLPEADRIINHVKENYLYYNNVVDFDKKVAEFKAKKDITIKDIEQFVYSVSLKDDIFTYVISGSYYDMLQQEMNTCQVSAREFADNAYYLRINSFNSTVAVDFKKAIDGIKNTENTTLIIDLRDNGGGMADPSNEILDLLLPECVTSYTVDRKGYMHSYYSDNNQVKFKNIIILVNENSASSAELLTLGLKKYLNNVTIVGQPTVGKGVGQRVFENKEKKYMIYLVNFFWNVREQNIAGSKITPDIQVQGTSDEDYFKEVRNLLAK